VPLSDAELRRYARHIVLPPIGREGQEKLRAASVLVVGAGGLGSTTLMYLAAAGVGRLGIVEPDHIELSNLQRQVLYETADIGVPKTRAAADRLNELNPDVKIDYQQMKLDLGNADRLIADYDLIIDGTDNYETRFILNDACLKANKPWVYGAMLGFTAQLSLFHGSPCYRCFITEHPGRERTCAQEGIIGPLAGVTGSLQALEAIKYVTAAGETLRGYLLSIDALTMQIKKSRLIADPACKYCA
jgi:molybdopterin/thiamine biosynthesis adenylyltransferase